jgi:hypothetical protein
MRLGTVPAPVDGPRLGTGPGPGSGPTGTKPSTRSEQEAKSGVAQFTDEFGEEHQKRRLLLESGQAEWVVELRPNLFVPEVAQGVGSLLRKLEAKPFSVSEVRILSLTTNEATNRNLRENVPDANRVDFDVESPTMEALRSALSFHAGKIVFVLGHFEKGTFLMVNPETNAEFSVSKEELTGMARECCQATVFALGCESAVSGGDAGVLTSFDTLDVAKKIPEVLRAQTYIEALSAMTSGEKPLVLLIDERFVVEPELSEFTAVAYMPTSGGIEEGLGERVGTVLYSASPPGPKPPATVAEKPVPTDKGSDPGCVILLIAAALAGVIAIIARVIHNRRRANR